jgi:hypothetical protein
LTLVSAKWSKCRARVFQKFGHEVRSMPAACVKAGIKRNKNDGAMPKQLPDGRMLAPFFHQYYAGGALGRSP